MIFQQFSSETIVSVQARNKTFIMGYNIFGLRQYILELETKNKLDKIFNFNSF